MKKFSSMPTPVGLSAASNVVYPTIKLKYNSANPVVSMIDTDGAVSVRSTVNGETHIDTYPSGLHNVLLSMSADANTLITIVGKVKSFTLSGYNGGSQDITVFETEKQDKLSSLYLNHNYSTAILSLSRVVLKGCTGSISVNVNSYALGELDTSLIPNATSINVAYCTFGSFVLNNNTKLSSVDIRSTTFPIIQERAQAFVDSLPTFTSGYHTLTISSSAETNIRSGAEAKGWTVSAS